jgi:HAD superfamily hydrolase (TIGR01549 family)
MIKALLCDLGDTLINFRHVNVLEAFYLGARGTYSFVQKDLKLSPPKFRLYHFYQQWAIRWAYLKSMITGREFNSVDILKRCAERMGLYIPDDRYDELAWQWYQPLAAQAVIDPYATDMLEECARRGLKLAIVSNTFVPPSALDRHLEQEDLLRFFPLRVYSCQFGLKKPRPEIFHHALEMLGVKPEEALFVGDSYPADIRGARGAGLYAAMQTTHRKKRVIPDRWTYQVETLAEIPGLIDRINAL